MYNKNEFCIQNLMETFEHKTFLITKYHALSHTKFIKLKRKFK